MVDQSYDRDVQFARGQLARDFALLGQAIVSPFKVLARINFAAPWSDRATGECKADA
jgi:hypothetical protein